ncbi:ferrochelatase [Microbacterium murale]|uniref:Coproporphyrin III ferrochelatase n=1 Tax=Microbacterium murale TaxID=1081040 RepID=A0ABU0PFD6_9MICO|nr:ferrochelatase [Microbacterium murale]MDQ0645637.1 ferrochelatase [Microbacterium murale]
MTAPDPNLVPFASSAAAGGPEFVETPVAYDALVLASFGGPEGQDEVIPFLRNVTRGRGIPDERLEEVAHHYRHFGGVSPINAQNRALKAALEAEIAGRGLDLPVYWGNRNSEPYLDEAFTAAADDGHATLLVLATSAYSSYSSDRQYREDIARAITDAGLEERVTADKVRLYFDHPGFVQPFQEGVDAAVVAFLEQGIPASDIHVLFSTHSIPTADAERSGPRTVEWGEGGAYVAQHRAVAAHIIENLAAVTGGRTVPWQLVFQSRSGPPTQPWLEPDINDVIAELPASGAKAVVIVPLGFVSDHMEVMWDLDTEAMESAVQAGLLATRTQTPGVHPAFVAGLVDLVIERLEGTPAADRPHLTDLGPWYDVSRAGDCENVRLGFKPAAAGLVP